MKRQTDPLDLVRKSRVRMSRRAGNDPARVVEALRREQVKYTPQIEKCHGTEAAVAEDYGIYATHSQSDANKSAADARGRTESNGVQESEQEGRRER